MVSAFWTRESIEGGDFFNSEEVASGEGINDDDDDG